MLTGKVRCPKCAARGRDRKGDNLAVYDDGHSYCFSCGYFVPADKLQQLKREKTAMLQQVHPPVNKLSFPIDYQRLVDLGTYTKSQWDAMNWLLTECGLTRDEMNFHNLGWSDERQMLIMPVYKNPYAAEHTLADLLMWQGRYFGPPNTMVSKYITYGPKDDINHVIEAGTDTKVVIVVEDLMSAIKVARQVDCMPLFGSDMSLARVRGLAVRFDTIGIWLDSDKRLESLKLALRASQLVNTFVIESGLDPKRYRDEMISQFIETGRQHMITRAPVVNLTRADARS